MTTRSILLLAAGLAAVIGAGAYFFDPGAGLPLAANPDDTLVVAAGEKLYAENCASCHGANLEGQANWRRPLPGGGLLAPPHDESGHTWHHPDQMLFDYSKLGGAKIAPAGFKSNMPGFGETLSDGEIWAILSFIKNRWPGPVRRRQERINRMQR
ncbi:MAG: cytochrome c [Rhodospirillales bacterium]|jgi:mono/diheme cytochrome c family protein|nr:cytochrome c [Rhodospirillales bacterium]MDP6643912.1 cytochrome c [Rhodospirillales bacterium]MDP6841346.1 cytochrome c [Rhodospirillales bacterium]